MFDFWATDGGREKFWAERSEFRKDKFNLSFPNGNKIECRILNIIPGIALSFTYFNNSQVSVKLSDADSGTILHLNEKDIPAENYAENYAGWVSVLMNLKAAADHGIDLRNHDENFIWNKGFIDN